MPGFDLLNGEPGTSLFENAVFGKGGDNDFPTDVAVPFDEYEKDLTVYNAFAGENANAVIKVMRLRDRLLRDQTVSRAWAIESQAYIPPNLRPRSVNTFTVTPSRTNYALATEMASWAVVGLAVAGLAALVALGWKLYNYINNGSTSGDSGPSSASVSSTSDAKEAKTTKALEAREERIEEYSKIYKELDDIFLKHSNPVVIKASVVGEEVYGKLSNKLKSTNGVTLDMQAMGEIIKAYYADKPETLEAGLFSGKPTSAAMYAFFSNPAVNKEIEVLVAEIKKELDSVSKVVNAYIEQFKNISDANTPEYGMAQQRDLNSLNTSVQGNRNKLLVLAEELKKKTELPPNPPSWSPSLDSILKAVSSKEDKFTTIYRSMQETLYVGENALSRKLGELLVAMNDLQQSAKKQLDDKAKSGTRPRTPEGDKDANRDTHAAYVDTGMGFLRNYLDQVKTTIKVTENFCTDIRKMDRAVANIIKKILQTADAIYNDNGIKITTFDERAKGIVTKLGGGANPT